MDHINKPVYASSKSDTLAFKAQNKLLTVFTHDISGIDIEFPAEIASLRHVASNNQDWLVVGCQDFEMLAIQIDVSNTTSIEKALRQKIKASAKLKRFEHHLNPTAIAIISKSA